MGLTLHYSFNTPSDIKKRNQAFDRLAKIHDFALELQKMGVFESVSEIKHFDKNFFKQHGTIQGLRNIDEEWQWALIQSDHHVERKAVKTGVDWRGRTVREDIRTSIYPTEAFIFRVYPAPGAEEANFGLCLYPSKITIKHFDQEAKVSTKIKGWRWSSFCKTQYANKYGTSNFLRAHVGLCALLDYIETSVDLEVDIYDEGEFWEDRDIKKLTQTVGEWDSLIAALVGTFQQSGIKIEEAPILDYPSFELLEEKGLESNPYFDNLREMLASIGKSDKLAKDAFLLSEPEDIVMWFRLAYSKIEIFSKTDDALGQISKELFVYWNTNIEGKYEDEVTEEAKNDFKNLVRRFQSLYMDIFKDEHTS